MPDDADFSSDLEIASIARAILKHVHREQHAPEYNDKGEKVCIDCGVDIPHKRAAITGVVRCIDCQVIEERYNVSRN
jgi:RNA polymerase-binding transcription factor DksA